MYTLLKFRRKNHSVLIICDEDGKPNPVDDRAYPDNYSGVYLASKVLDTVNDRIEVEAAIARRAMKQGLITREEIISLAMDLSCVSLSLHELLYAPQMDFIHDICGIRRNMNRETGLLENCFSPRYARKEGNRT